MKKIAKIFLSAVFLFGIWSCNKQENKVVLQGGTPPVLTASSKDSIPVSFAHKDEKAIQITWTNPNYQFNTGISSLDVNYTIEIDTAGANFTNPNKSVISIGTDLSKSFTQNELNNQLLALQLAPDVSHNIQIRVTSMLLGGAEPLTSNVLSFKVTPFTLPPVVTPPSTGALYITGSATPASWQCGCGEAAPASQTFTKISNTLFEITINLTANGSYLFLPQYGSWSVKYGGTGSNNANNVNGDNFKINGGDLKAPSTGGNYKIRVDFQAGTFSVIKL